MAEGLEAEVKQLKSQVARMARVLASTGQQVLQLQMQLRQQGVNELDSRTRELQTLVPASKPAGASASRAGGAGAAGAAGGAGAESYVTEADLTDMVGELQGQLSLLDERSVRRILNSRSTSRLVALPNDDSEEHPQFPRTIAAVQALSDEQLFEQWNFYEMLPTADRLEDLLDGQNTAEAKEGNRRMMQEIYDSFVKYIGLDPAQHPRKA